jgi:hypothetical protein
MESSLEYRPLKMLLGTRVDKLLSDDLCAEEEVKIIGAHIPTNDR